MSFTRFAWMVSAGLLVFVGLLGTSEPAHACGGLFCSAAAPVNQAAERIIFSKNADGTVTAVVQIQYEGPSEEFAWVLPVPGIPDVLVSSDLAFTRLQLASNPQYNLTTVVEGECDTFRDNAASGAGGTGGVVLNGGGGQGGDGGILVLAEGNVGPYDFVVVQPDGSFENVGDVMVEWLTNEGYDVVPPGGNPDDISALLGSYLEGGMNLIAFRLTKGNDEGTIRPIRITYESDQPMIPIRPTAVAANDDMGVMVWVLGENRAVPVNYRSLELNEALIDWLTAGSNYNQVVIAAANEAGGQGFVTERAGSRDDYENVVVLEGEREAWTALQRNAPARSSEDLLRDSLVFSGWDGYQEVLEGFLPPEEVSNFLQCPQCTQSFAPFDKASFLNALETEVILPMLDTEELVQSRPYATRLYTTLSAPEMDVDPLFDFNPDLDDVSNIHAATRVIECSPVVSFSEAPSRVELEDGRVVRLPPGGGPWPFSPGAEDAPPANAIVAQLTTSGPGTIVTDNGAEIDAALGRHNASVPLPPEYAMGGGCAASAGHAGLAGWLGLGLALLLARRRRGS